MVVKHVRRYGWLIALASLSGCAGSGSQSGAVEPRGTGGVTYNELPADRQATVGTYPVADDLSGGGIPASFDGRTYWMDSNGHSCLTPAWEQGNTDFCWAFSSSTVASDRYRIANALNPTGVFFQTATYNGYSGSGQWNGPVQTVLNGFEPMATGECSISGGGLGCNQTGNPMEGFDFLFKKGGPLLAQWGNYTCQGSCPSLSGVDLYTVGQPYWVTTPGAAWTKANVAKIQAEVLANGPVCTHIRIPPKFNDWWSGPTSATDVYGPDDTGGKYYRSAGSSGLPGHLVVIVGWGTSASGEDYWIIRNSWGQGHAQAGYFFLHRGDNFITCETSVAATHPGTDVPIG